MDGSTESVGVHRSPIGVSRSEQHDFAWRICCEPSIPCAVSSIGFRIGCSRLKRVFESGNIEFSFPAWNPICRISKDFPDKRNDSRLDDFVLKLFSRFLIKDRSIS